MVTSSALPVKIFNANCFRVFIQAFVAQFDILDDTLRDALSDTSTSLSLT